MRVVLVRKAERESRHARHARLVADILARMSRGCYEETVPVEFQLIKESLLARRQYNTATVVVVHYTRSPTDDRRIEPRRRATGAVGDRVGTSFDAASVSRWGQLVRVD